MSDLAPYLVLGVFAAGLLAAARHTIAAETDRAAQLTRCGRECPTDGVPPDRDDDDGAAGALVASR